MYVCALVHHRLNILSIPDDEGPKLDGYGTVSRRSCWFVQWTRRRDDRQVM